MTLLIPFEEEIPFFKTFPYNTIYRMIGFPLISLLQKMNAF